MTQIALKQHKHALDCDTWMYVWPGHTIWWHYGNIPNEWRIALFCMQCQLCLCSTFPTLYSLYSVHRTTLPLTCSRWLVHVHDCRVWPWPARHNSPLDKCYILLECYIVMCYTLSRHNITCWKEWVLNEWMNACSFTGSCPLSCSIQVSWIAHMQLVSSIFRLIH